jgi:hypothetical protein
MNQPPARILGYIAHYHAGSRAFCLTCGASCAAIGPSYTTPPPSGIVCHQCGEWVSPPYCPDCGDNPYQCQCPSQGRKERVA